MNGWIVERSEVGKPGDFSHLSDEELDAQLSQHLKARGVPDRYIRNFLQGPHWPTRSAPVARCRRR
jgi:hypothetical protein